VMYNAKRQRFLEILKMRGTNHSTEIHHMDLGNKGFKIDKKPATAEFSKCL